MRPRLPARRIVSTCWPERSAKPPLPGRTATRLSPPCPPLAATAPAPGLPAHRSPERMLHNCLFPVAASVANVVAGAVKA